jgi:hypothetical protein
LKWSLGGPLSKLCVTPSFSINLRCQIENQVSDYRLLGASSLSCFVSISMVATNGICQSSTLIISDLFHWSSNLLILLKVFLVGYCYLTWFPDQMIFLSFNSNSGLALTTHPCDILKPFVLSSCGIMCILISLVAYFVKILWYNPCIVANITILFFNLSILIVDESCSENAWSALNLISTFLLLSLGRYLC